MEPGLGGRQYGDVSQRESLDAILERIERDLRDGYLLCHVTEDNHEWGVVGISELPGGDESATKDVEDAVASIAHEIAYNLWPFALTDPWPLCPEHHDHPLDPDVTRGRAAWTCLHDASVAIPIGSLR